MIFLVRHGQTDWNLENRIQGHLDMPLNETGRNEAHICAQRLVSCGIDSIVASDLSRTRETAGIINDALHLPIRFDARLRETNCGDLQGKLTKDVTDQEWDDFNHDPHKIHAESLEDVYKRARSCFDEIDATKNTLIVTHGGVIRMAHYLTYHPDEFIWEEFEKDSLHFKIKNTEIFTWDKKVFQPLQDGE